MIIDEKNNDMNKILVDIMDALYSTHTKFKDIGSIIKLNFNVIYLLGYVYPEWKSKVGKNFIPHILESLENTKLKNESDLNAIELLKHLLGCDGKSEPNEDLLKLSAEKNAV